MKRHLDPFSPAERSWECHVKDTQAVVRKVVRFLDEE
jgi:hypothetical protein